MPFSPGISGNPLGRPKGTKNKTNEKLRCLISAFLEDNFEEVKADFQKLEPKDRIRLYVDLLQYSVPKLQAVSSSIDFEKMGDEELDEIINQLLKHH